jgi:hypothetical protein
VARADLDAQVAAQEQRPGDELTRGTSTVPPPALLQVSMACWMAFVFRVLPSPRAPKRVTS